MERKLAQATPRSKRTVVPGSLLNSAAGEGRTSLHATLRSLLMTAASTRIFLLRHGEVDPAWHGRIYGSLDVPLSAHGMDQGRRTASALRDVEIQAVVSSGLARTEHCAACLRAERRLPRIDDSELRELERGQWAGLSIAELENRIPGAWSAWFRAPANSFPPGGESLAELFRRVSPRVDHWARAHAGHSLALVTHGWVVRVLVCHALDASFDLAPRLDVRTGDVTVLKWPLAGGRPELQAFAADLRDVQLSE